MPKLNLSSKGKENESETSIFGSFFPGSKSVIASEKVMSEIKKGMESLPQILIFSSQSMQPIVVDLRYFKLLILSDKIT